MNVQRNDRQRLLDMRDKAARILREYAKLDDQPFADEDLRYDGLIRLVGIIGEAAYKLSRELRAAHPEIPWRAIVAPGTSLCTTTTM